MIVDFNSSLKKLEDLSIKISDLIHENKFNEIPTLDALRREIINTISKDKSLNKKEIFSNMISENEKLISNSEKKLTKFKSNHSKFSNVFQAYSSSK